MAQVGRRCGRLPAHDQQGQFACAGVSGARAQQLAARQPVHACNAAMCSFWPVPRGRLGGARCARRGTGGARVAGRGPSGDHVRSVVMVCASVRHAGVAESSPCCRLAAYATCVSGLHALAAVEHRRAERAGCCHEAAALQLGWLPKTKHVLPSPPELARDLPLRVVRRDQPRTCGEYMESTYCVECGRRTTGAGSGRSKRAIHSRRCSRAHIRSTARRTACRTPRARYALATKSYADSVARTLCAALLAARDAGYAWTPTLIPARPCRRGRGRPQHHERRPKTACQSSLNSCAHSLTSETPARCGSPKALRSRPHLATCASTAARLSLPRSPARRGQQSSETSQGAAKRCGRIRVAYVKSAVKVSVRATFRAVRAPLR